MSGSYVQYGCGWKSPDGWLNFDASPTLRFERIPLIGRMYIKNALRFPKNVYYGDIVRGLPVEKASCSALYCSHVLEHLSLGDFQVAIKNSFDSLKSGGVFRMVLPDLEYLVDQYRLDQSNCASKNFMKSAHLGQEKSPQSLVEKISLFFGNSRHLWMWDYRSLAFELKEVGFVSIRRASFGDSGDDMFRLVEDQERWKNCLGLECIKP